MEKVVRTIDERFHYSASGFLAEIETRIVSQRYERKLGGIVYRMLVIYPKSLILRMRRLSRGSKVLATKIEGRYTIVCSQKRHMPCLRSIRMQFELLGDESLKRPEPEIHKITF